MKTYQELTAFIEDRLKPIITAERHKEMELAVAEFANQFSGQVGAPDFSEAEAYRVGDIVRRDGALRVFTAAHAPGKWSDGDNVQFSIVKAVSELEGRIDDARNMGVVKKLSDYLYDVEYNALDYGFARDYFESKAPTPNLGACSAVAVGNTVGRNYDWWNDYTASFATHTPAVQGRHATVGMAGGLKELSVQFVESGAHSELYRILPFYLQDGVNDAGLFAEVNVVPSLGNRQTTPLVERRDRVCSLMLVRYLLDNFASVSEAANYIRDYVEVFNPTSLTEMGYELHWLLHDETKSVVLEVVDGEVVILSANVSTNFHLSGVTLGEGGRVFTNADVKDGHLPSSQGIESNGSGLERWNIIVNTISSDGWTWQGLMDSLNYTKAYTELVNVWNSEFVGGDITVDTPADDAALLARIAEQRQKYAERSKDTAETWHTVHSCIYDLSRMEMSVAVQEETVRHKTIIDESSEYELKTNKVTHIDEDSTDEQYASAKCIFEELKSKQKKITYDADEEALTIN